MSNLQLPPLLEKYFTAAEPVGATGYRVITHLEGNFPAGPSTCTTSSPSGTA